MSPDRVDLAEDALASEDPATLYNDLLDDWNMLYRRLARAAGQLETVASKVENLELAAHLRGQSEGIYLATNFMREYRAEPAL